MNEKHTDRSRLLLATALAKLDGITLIEINSTVGDPDNANAWRKYLGRADDLNGLLADTAADRIEALETALKPFAEVAEWAERNGCDLTKDCDMLLRGLNGKDFGGHLGVQGPEFIAARAAITRATSA